MPYDVNIKQSSPSGLLNLRGNETICTLFNTVLGLELPQTPNTTAAIDDVIAMWLGPDEWLVKTGDGKEAALSAALLQAVEGKHAAVTVISDAYMIFTISGKDARAVLNQGTGIDLHPRSFSPGACARTNLGKTGIILYQVDDTPAYDVYVWRSYAQYLGLWMNKATGS